MGVYTKAIDRSKKNTSAGRGPSLIDYLGTHGLKFISVAKKPPNEDNPKAKGDYFRAEFEVLDSGHQDLKVGTSISWGRSDDKGYGWGIGEVGRILAAAAGKDYDALDVDEVDDLLTKNMSDYTLDDPREVLKAPLEGASLCATVYLSKKTNKEGQPFKNVRWEGI